MTIEPATDEEVERWGLQPGMYTDSIIVSCLVARIRIERENAIKECADAIDNMRCIGPCYAHYDNMANEIRSLLKAPSKQDGDRA